MTAVTRVLLPSLAAGALLLTALTVSPAVAGEQEQTAAVTADDTVSRRLGPVFWIAIGWVVLIAVLAILAPWLPIKDPDEHYIDRSLGLIRDAGCQAGLVFNPATPLHYMDHVMDKLDLVLLMSVNPGFGGQQFIPETLNKLRAARAKIDAWAARSGRRILLEVDGGVKVDNIAEIARAGADTFVAGSAVFGAGRDSDPNRYDSVIAALRAELASVGGEA